MCTSTIPKISMLLFIVYDDLGYETNMKNLIEAHFCSMIGCQLIAQNEPAIKAGFSNKF
jgi:hypothetical protein